MIGQRGGGDRAASGADQTVTVTSHDDEDAVPHRPMYGLQNERIVGGEPCDHRTDLKVMVRRREEPRHRDTSFLAQALGRELVVHEWVQATLIPAQRVPSVSVIDAEHPRRA